MGFKRHSVPLHGLTGGLSCALVTYVGAGDLNGPQAFMAVFLRPQETFFKFSFSNNPYTFLKKSSTFLCGIWFKCKIFMYKVIMCACGNLRIVSGVLSGVHLFYFGVVFCSCDRVLHCQTCERKPSTSTFHVLGF